MKGVSPEEAGARRATAPRRLAEARDSFRVGDLEGAKETLAGLLDEGLAFREVYLLLADVYRAEGEARLAQDTLKMAANAPRAPVAEGAEWKAAPGQGRVFVAPPLPIYWPVLVGGGVLALAAAVGCWWMPARVQWLFFNPLQLALVAAAGFLALGSLAASGAIRTFDQELTELGPGESLPLWVYLLIAGVFSAWMGIAVLLWAQYVQGEATRTIGIVLGTLVVLGAVIGVAMGGGGAFWWLGLNVLWLSSLLGWALGSIASPREWWQG